ncbi:MAG: UvrD-helicase domain-containing protein [Magnetococcales bacterium]|nr:UvrD-helicase domain-containing protein [Magnetococcales bacterium]
MSGAADDRLPPTLAGLNPPQREAVTAGTGPLMVLAGAGSGKTRVLTHRLAHLIVTNACHPGELLAVTFTNKAAREMRERLVSLLAGMDRPAGGGLWIGTFHAMAARMLRSHAERLGFADNFTILDTGDQERLIRQVAQAGNFKHSYWTPKRLVQLFSRWKDSGVGPDQVGEEQLPNPRDRDLVIAFYRHYQEALRRANCMDFGDLLLNCLLLWQREPTVLELYANRFRHILVDEYQDTNLVQYRWLQHLSGVHGNLCVVGDDDQSIYSWRGARLDNILRFADDFPGTRVVRLEQNYRSTGHILDVAGSLIRNNTGRMAKTLWTAGAAGDKVVLYTAEDGEDEARFIADEIHEGTPDGGYGRFAILVRTARQTRSLEEALLRRGIPYQMVGGLRFMERAEIKDALAYLRLAQSDRDDPAFERIVNTPARGVGETSLNRIRQAAARDGIPLMTAVREMMADGGLKGKAGGGCRALLDLVDKGRGRLTTHAPADVLEFLLQESGYLSWLAQDERGPDRLDNLQELKNELSRRGSLILFLEEAALVTDLMERTGAAGASSGDWVLISTLHAAKGLEFPVVFLAGLEEELLPHKLALEESANGLEEERRLAYVGMTRARERLFLTCARRRWVYNRLEVPLPSRFLREIPGDLLEKRRQRLAVGRGVGRVRRQPGGSW